MSDTTSLKAAVESYYFSKYTEEEYAALTDDEKAELVCLISERPLANFYSLSHTLC